MGTNYYFVKAPTWKTLFKPRQRLHIGKSSAGWAFSLHVIPEEGLNSLHDWLKLFGKYGYIENEYGETISRLNMVLTITARDHFHGLQRHPIDGVHCIKHGAGTWDLVTGEFS